MSLAFLSGEERALFSSRGGMICLQEEQMKVSWVPMKWSRALQQKENGERGMSEVAWSNG